MFKPKLTDSVSLEELKRMRENGMTNRQIADNLGVGYSTICAYLGRQPSGLKAPYGYYKTKETDVEPEPVPQAEKKPVLQKLCQIEEYAGQNHKFTVRRDMGLVTIYRTVNEDGMQYHKNELEEYITELLDILAML